MLGQVLRHTSPKALEPTLIALAVARIPRCPNAQAVLHKATSRGGSCKFYCKFKNTLATETCTCARLPSLHNAVRNYSNLSFNYRAAAYVTAWTRMLCGPLLNPKSSQNKFLSFKTPDLMAFTDHPAPIITLRVPSTMAFVMDTLEIHSLSRGAENSLILRSTQAGFPCLRVHRQPRCWRTYMPQDPRPVPD